MNENEVMELAQIQVLFVANVFLLAYIPVFCCYADDLLFFRYLYLVSAFVVVTLHAITIWNLPPTIPGVIGYFQIANLVLDGIHTFTFFFIIIYSEIKRCGPPIKYVLVDKQQRVDNENPR